MKERYPRQITGGSDLLLEQSRKPSPEEVKLRQEAEARKDRLLAQSPFPGTMTLVMPQEVENRGRP